MEDKKFLISFRFTQLVIGITIISMIWMFWNFNASLEQTHRIDEIKKTETLRLQKIREQFYLFNPEKSIKAKDTQSTQQIFKKFLSQISEIQNSLNLELSEELNKSIQEYQSKINEAFMLPSPDELISTLKQKVTQLNLEAQGRKWRNIIRWSETMKIRLNTLSQNGQYESPLVRYLSSDHAALIALVKTSDLSISDKNKLLKDLEVIDHEIEMLNELHRNKKDLIAKSQKTELALSRWLNRAESAIGNLRYKNQIELMRLKKYFYGIFLVLMFFWSLVWVGWRIVKKNTQSIILQKTLDVIRQGIKEGLPVWNKWSALGNKEELKNEILILRKKLSLGSELSEGFPFAYVLLDQNENMVMGNNYFCEQFEISPEDLVAEVKDWKLIEDKIIGFDYQQVKKFVIDEGSTMRQIQWRMNDGSIVPYEIYISLVGNSHQKILVIFYPLAMHRETIIEQSKLVMSPIRDSLRLIQSGQWNHSIDKKLPPAWKEMSFEKDWDLLVSVIDQMSKTSQDLLLQLNTLEDEKRDLIKLFIEQGNRIEAQHTRTKRRLAWISQVKNNLLSLDQLSSDFCVDHIALQQLSRAMNKKIDLTYDLYQNLFSRFVEIKEGITQLEFIKSFYRKFKLEISETKKEIFSSHNKFLMELPTLDMGLQRIASDLKDNFEKLDMLHQTLDKNFSNIDLVVTKISINLTGQIPLSEKSSYLNDINNHERVAQEISQALHEDQEKLIIVMKELVNSLKEDLNTPKELLVPSDNFNNV